METKGLSHTKKLSQESGSAYAYQDKELDTEVILYRRSGLKHVMLSMQKPIVPCESLQNLFLANNNSARSDCLISRKGVWFDFSSLPAARQSRKSNMGEHLLLESNPQRSEIRLTRSAEDAPLKEIPWGDSTQYAREAKTGKLGGGQAPGASPAGGAIPSNTFSGFGCRIWWSLGTISQRRVSWNAFKDGHVQPQHSQLIRKGCPEESTRRIARIRRADPRARAAYIARSMPKQPMSFLGGAYGAIKLWPMT
jgi:hypothetical protein